jgi:histidinol-phosphate aminotransferase
MIDWIQRMFLNRGDAIVDVPPSFEMYGFFARVNGARIISAPRRADFAIDLDAVESAAGDGKIPPKLLYLANPSNPDGGLASPAEMEQLLALPVMIVLDEAYAEFAGESYASRVPTQPNLIVVRTFSKWAGMAGLRVGYAVAPQPIAAKLWQCKAPENVNAAGIVAARASIDDAEYLLANVRRIVEERERLSAELKRLGFIDPIPSRTNFILCRVEGREARAIHDALAARGILIRAFSSPRLAGYIRVSVGTPEQDDILLRALREIGA